MDGNGHMVRCAACSKERACPDCCACRFRRAEIVSVGFDDGVELYGSDYAGTPYATGLRVPDLPHVRYRFLLCVADLHPGDRIVGLFQSIVLGAKIFPAGAASGWYLAPKEQTTKGWHFIDGNVVWYLTRDTTTNTPEPKGAFDGPSFRFHDTDDCALVYASAHFPAAPTQPGYLGLDGYTPPAMRGTPQLVLRDLRYPWDEPHAIGAINFCAGDMMERWRVYADVFQTQPTVIGDTPARFQPVLVQNAFTGSVAPEDLFLAWASSQGAPARYHSVAARLVLDRKGGR